MDGLCVCVCVRCCLARGAAWLTDGLCAWLLGWTRMYAGVDWWSLGILIYELVFGLTPFRGSRRDETFENIIKAPLRFPAKPIVSDECR